MKAQHTPGPWCLLPEEKDKPYIRVRGTRLGRRFKVANVLNPVYEGVHEREAQETRANARLIEAAPDLLDALIAARPWIVTDRNTFAECARVRHLSSQINGDDAVILSGYDAAIDSIDAAIAKATGEAP